jgi:hypothetical protein
MYSEGRNCPFDKTILENALNELVASFSLIWLTSDTGHPLQALWKREDYLSSIELANLGCSILKTKRINLDYSTFQVFPPSIWPRKQLAATRIYCLKSF